jgi:hypothetical protein
VFPNRLSELATLLESITVKPQSVDPKLIAVLFDTLSVLVGIGSVQVVYAGQEVMSTISACLRNVTVRNDLACCEYPELTLGYRAFKVNTVRPEIIKLSPVLDMIRSEFVTLKDGLPLSAES